MISGTRRHQPYDDQTVVTMKNYAKVNRQNKTVLSNCKQFLYSKCSISFTNLNFLFKFSGDMEDNFRPEMLPAI